MKNKKEDKTLGRDKYFKALADLLYLSIKRQEDDIAYTIHSHFYQKFANYRRKYQAKPQKYPDTYYQVTYKAAEELALLKSKRFSFLTEATFGGTWLIGELGEYPIQEETYRAMWGILMLALEYEREDLFMRFWIRSNQYVMFNLKPILPDFDFANIGAPAVNQEEIDKREKERKRFFEFTNALGGLVLYKHKYGLLKKMFIYTNSEPPKFTLLPETMDEIFYAYFEFRDPHNENLNFLLAKYYFPDIDGIGSEGIIRNWICKYMALLFLRQYTLFKRLSTDRPFDLPTIPVDQSKKKFWIDNLGTFFKQVEELRSNNELMETLQFDHMTNGWFVENEKPTPQAFYEDLKQSLNQEFENEELNQELSESKTGRFYESTAEKITKAIQEIEPIDNKSKLDPNVEYGGWFLSDITSILPRSSFLDNVVAPSLNAHSIIAEEQSRRIKQFTAENFHLIQSNSYLLKNELLFDAIDKIVKRASNKKDFVIVNFGIYLGYLINQLKINKLSETDYDGIPILLDTNYFNQLAGRSIYLLRKEDLPYMIFREPTEQLKDTYRLQPIEYENHREYKLHASITDLRKVENADLKEELSSSDEDLDKSVYIYIYTGLELRWKKSAKVIELKQYNEFQEKGIPDSLDDVKVSL